MAKSNRVTVVDYNPQWVEDFKTLVAPLDALLSEYILSIEHVGSTSVPGLAAKPKIDIDIVVASFEKFAAIKQAMQSLDYHHLGDLGVPKREAFRYVGSENKPAHNLYVCLQGTESLENHLTLRNFLRTNPEQAATYGKLKKELANKFPNDMDAYIAGKTAFICEILEQCGFDADSLARIRIVNL